MKISNATPNDLADIRSVLAESSLPSRDCEPHLANFFIARLGAKPVGVGGLELIGVDGLVRSIAVLPPFRGSGIGRALYQHVADRAIHLGARRLYLLTESAEKFFGNLDFAPIARGDTPRTIAGTRQFRELCPRSATVMYREVVRSVQKHETRPPNQRKYAARRS